VAYPPLQLPNLPSHRRQTDKKPAPAPEYVIVGTSADREGYTGDPFNITEDGHYLGENNFLVPKNFDEFYERYPKYILNWVKRRLNRWVVDEEVEDWTQDLIIHMKYLPAKSKYRLAGTNGKAEGCQDVIETFNPYNQYGASERRFRHYVNNCLGNKFNTVFKKSERNPLCRRGNVTIDNVSDCADFQPLVVNDEWCHLNSASLSRASENTMNQNENHMLANEFFQYVKKEDANVLPIMEAIGKTSTQSQAAEYLTAMTGATNEEFVRLRNRLKQLGNCFLKGKHVPKQRKPYKKREKAAEELSVAVEME
jgi:hypothetical protein